MEEINRIPEETLNVLITVMSEAELHVPRLGRVVAAPGFRLVAAMNPFDAVGTARISSAVYDRTCRLLVDYQSAEEEAAIVERAVTKAEVPGASTRRGGQARRAGPADPDPSRGPHRLVGARRHRRHGGGREPRRELRGLPVSNPSVGLDAAMIALSGRIRLREGTTRTAEEIVTELWAEVFGRRTDGEGQGKAGAPNGATSSPS